jgi:hypothetical protein
MNLPSLIGIVGCEGSGRTTLAARLDQNYGYFKNTLAHPRRRMLRALGMDEECLVGQARQQVLPGWGNRTPQQLLDSLAEWGVTQCGPDIWSAILFAHVRHMMSRGARVVVDDVSSDAEARAIVQAGGILVRLDDGKPWDGPAFTMEINHVVMSHPREFKCLTHAMFNIRW